ncbi:hypothetical protein [Inhella sp.]|uniref:hypothetical protein n=1 Tax=Inhella sp. TaxID=1921806 RepID=UPI0035B1F28D
MAKKRAAVFDPLPERSVFMRELAVQARVKDIDQRLTLLADRLGIPDDEHRWRSLAILISWKYVFPDAPLAHRPKLWTAATREQLRLAMQPLIDSGMRQIEAAKKLSNMSPWKSLHRPWADSDAPPAEALVRHYRRAVKEHEEQRQVIRAAQFAAERRRPKRN